MDRASDRFLIWGAGGHGRVIADLVRARGHRIVGYVDSDREKLGRVVEPGGVTVVMHQDQLLESLDGSRPVADIDSLALAIGDNGARLDLARRAERFDTPPLVHPTAVVSPSVSIGRASVVLATAAINAAVEIGVAAIINTGAIIEHDCVIGDGAHVSPGAVLAGGVRVGARGWIGAGAVVLPGVVIGSDAVVGAGAVVLQDVGAGLTVIGNPATLLSRAEKSDVVWDERVP